MYQHQGRHYSSFLPIAEHPPNGISNNFHVATVRSGSQGNGGHVSVYLEMTEPTVPNGFSTILMDLIAMEGSDEPVIQIKHVQLTNSNGQYVMDSLDPKRGPAKLLQTHHTCYKIGAVKSGALIAAAKRFQGKAKNGRYAYHQGGGIRASLSTANRYKVRGVNCGDFVIKILKVAGIAVIGRKYTSQPFRVAGG